MNPLVSLLRWSIKWMRKECTRVPLVGLASQFYPTPSVFFSWQVGHIPLCGQLCALVVMRQILHIAVQYVYLISCIQILYIYTAGNSQQCICTRLFSILLAIDSSVCQIHHWQCLWNYGFLWYNNIISLDQLTNMGLAQACPNYWVTYCVVVCRLAVCCCYSNIIL